MYFCSELFVFRATFYFTIPYCRLIRINSPPNYCGLAKVYCNSGGDVLDLNLEFLYGWCNTLLKTYFGFYLLSGLITNHQVSKIDSHFLFLRWAGYKKETSLVGPRWSYSKITEPPWGPTALKQWFEGSSTKGPSSVRSHSYPFNLKT
jgi:hypothetical protein